MIAKTLIVFLSCLFIILLFIPIPDVLSSRLIESLWPVGHIAMSAFAAWLLISFNQYTKNSTSIRQFFILLIATLFFGGAIELIQPFFDRSAQLNDIYYNLLGALSAYLFIANFKLNKKKVLIVRSLYILFFLYLIAPLMYVAKDEYAMRVDFPILANFTSLPELTRWKADLPLSIVQAQTLSKNNLAGLHLMKATFAVKEASRVVLRFFPSDWQNYQQITFSFFNPNDQTLKIRLIMTDEAYNQVKSDQDDRFEKWLVIKPGWGEYSVDLAAITNAPKTRKLDLTSMAGIDFYMYRLNKPVVLYFNKIALR